MSTSPRSNIQQDSFGPFCISARNGLKRPRRLWGQKWLILFLYIGIILQGFNQRIGWLDIGGPSLLIFFLRSEVWFAFAVILALFSVRQLKIVGLSKKILFDSSLVLIGAIFISSVINGFLNNSFMDYFGIADLFKCVVATIIGLIIYRLARSPRGISECLVGILMWAPLINCFVAILVLAFGINNIQGFNELADGGDGGAGFIGLGGRFQGVGSNANIPAVQCCIAIGILMPKLIYSGASLLKKVCLAIYGLALGILVLWTGVRSAILSIFIMLVLFIWLNFRLTLRSLLQMLAIMILVVCFIEIILALTPTNLNIFNQRLESEDGRLSLWSYYGSLLLRNPLGFGLGFESIVDTNIGIQGLRLPPHNAILQAGMYAGYIGGGVSLYLIYKVLAIIAQIKLSMQSIDPPLNLIGLALAWCSLVTNQMFAGFLSAEFNFSILTALILSDFLQPGLNLTSVEHKATNG